MSSTTTLEGEEGDRGRVQVTHKRESRSAGGDGGVASSRMSEGLDPDAVLSTGSSLLQQSSCQSWLSSHWMKYVGGKTPKIKLESIHF